MNGPVFLPFYERGVARLPSRLLGELVVSILLGGAFFGAHYLSVGREVLNDWSWLLGVLISMAMLCLFYATDTLRSIVPEMTSRLQADDEGVHSVVLRHCLSDTNFVMAGVFFGILNCGVGLLLGLPRPAGAIRVAPLAGITILSGYFVAGFVCGMAVLGISGMSLSIRAFAQKAKPTFDFTSPDRCGGTQFLGEALVIFGSVTLVVGVLISAYLVLAPWYTSDEVTWVRWLKYFWIGFPYVMSIVALLAPAIPIHVGLREYKMEQDLLLHDRLMEISARLGDTSLDAAAHKELREDYEFQRAVREQLYRMRTWPYGLNADMKYAIVLLANLSASVGTVMRWSNGPPS